MSILELGISENKMLKKLESKKTRSDIMNMLRRFAEEIYKNPLPEWLGMSSDKGHRGKGRAARKAAKAKRSIVKASRRANRPHKQSLRRRKR